MEARSQSTNILQTIVEARRKSVQHRQNVLPQAALRIAVEKKAPKPRGFTEALSKPGINVISELKRASPSLGIIRQEYDPISLAGSLERAGAAALSVLTEEDFFHGSLTDLKSASRATNIPILRKDFIIDPWQVWETRAAGADAFLLIAAVLHDQTLQELIVLGRSLEIEPLVEVHSREELCRALDAGARIIGVNNRDLRDFSVHLEISLELIEQIPDECVAVSESGLRSQADLARLRAAGFDSFLIGEHLMTSQDPGAALKSLLGLAATRATE
ncbi:MAG: indole-3-glycerol phosphate synthase TrpC [Candidatus Acidiferrales bacterium]